MTTTFLYFFIESSIYLLFFLVVYRLFIANLTYFNWMRFYLLVIISLCLILPFIEIPGKWTHSIFGHSHFENTALLNMLNPIKVPSPETLEPGMHSLSNFNVWEIFVFIISVIYFCGVIYKTIRLLINLHKIRLCILKNTKQKEGKFWIITTDKQVVAFSFFHFIFINSNLKNLSSNEIQQIVRHEMIHATQMHTLDIILVEVIGIILWFNPLVNIAKHEIQTVHEYIADEKIAGSGQSKKQYVQLLFNLASEQGTFCLSTGFSGKQINNRIEMVYKSRSLPAHKLFFAILIPVAALLLLSFSYFVNAPTLLSSSLQYNEVHLGDQSITKIGKINWVNNTVLSSAELTRMLGLKKGDEYSKTDFEKRLIAENGVSATYLDKGYLFFNIEIAETAVSNNCTDLTLTVNEGVQGKIGNVSIKGNKLVPTQEILNHIMIHSGDFFSKTKIVQSIRALSMMGQFDPETIRPNIIPLPKKADSEFAIVDIEFEVTEKK